MKNILFLAICIVSMLSAYGQKGISQTSLPAMQFNFKILPTTQQLQQVTNSYTDYIKDLPNATQPPLWMHNNKKQKNAINCPPLFNMMSFFSKNTENQQFPYSLSNARLLEAILANGYNLQGYILVDKTKDSQKMTKLTITGYEHKDKIFYAILGSEKIELTYKNICTNLVFAEIGNKPVVRNWQLQFIREKYMPETKTKAYSQSEAITIQAKNLGEAISEGYRTLSKKYKSFKGNDQKISCIGHIIQPPRPSAQPNFVKFNYELYMYKFKGGVYGKGEVITIPYSINTNYSFLKFRTLSIDKTRCSNYIGDQHDPCEGWGSFYVDHVIIGTTFDPSSGRILFKIVGFRNCNVAKYSFKNYKVATIVRGDSEWIAF